MLSFCLGNSVSLIENIEVANTQLIFTVQYTYEEQMPNFMSTAIQKMILSTSGKQKHHGPEWQDD